MVKSTRLYARAVSLGYRRSRHTQRENQSLIKIEGVRSSEDAKWYLGKRLVYSYKVKAKGQFREVKHTDKKKEKTEKKQVLKTKNIIGKVIGLHGATGTVRGKFNSNLPTQALGRLIKVLLYPHRPT